MSVVLNLQKERNYYKIKRLRAFQSFTIYRNKIYKFCIRSFVSCFSLINGHQWMVFFKFTIFFNILFIYFRIYKRNNYYTIERLTVFQSFMTDRIIKISKLCLIIAFGVNGNIQFKGSYLLFFIIYFYNFFSLFKNEYRYNRQLTIHN